MRLIASKPECPSVSATSALCLDKRANEDAQPVGEIAEMMLDGTMCEGCGEFMNIGGEPPGYPVRCAACGEEPDDSQPVNYQPPKTVACPNAPSCERMFHTSQAASQHWRDKHG